MEINVGFWRRTLSFIVDLMIINMVIFYPFRDIFTKHPIGWESLSEAIISSEMYLAIFLMSVLALMYFAFFEYYLSQTPGQMMLRIKVVQDVGFWKAVIRNCYILPFFPFYALWIVEPIYLALYGERLLEKITGTCTKYEFDSSNGSRKKYILKKVE